MTRTIYKIESKRKDVANTRRVERTLKLIKLLNNQWRTIEECKIYIDVHYKSIHRYFSMLVQLGFVVERAHFKRTKYKITNVDEFFKSHKI